MSEQQITVLQFCEHFGGKEASLHGVARAFQWWIPAFDASRFRVLLCSRKGRDKAAEQMEQGGLQPIYLGYSKLDPRNLFKLMEILRRENVDIIHAHGYGACTWGRIAGRRRGIPVVVHERCNTHVVPWFQRPVEWWLGRSTQYALAVSESSRQFCIKGRYMRPEAVRVLYHGILMDDVPPADPEWIASTRREFGAGENEKVIGIVGRLESHKGHLDAFEALERVREEVPGAQLWVVGDGAYADTLKRWVGKHGREDIITFLGFRRDARKLIRCFDVQLFPSHMEGTPNTLYEAMAVGNTAVASTADGQGEVLADGQHALMFVPGDVKWMAKQLVRVLKDPGLAAMLGRNLQALAGKFDGRNAIKTLEALYEEMVRNP